MNRHCLVIALAALAGLSSAALAQEEYEFKEGQWVKGAVPARGTPAGELAIIRRMVNLGADYAAVSAAKDFLVRYPEEPIREEVMMLAGQAEMNRGRYFQAYEWYKRQWEDFPSGEYSERALQREYEIAEAFLGGKKRLVAYVFLLPAQSEGLEILNHIAEQAPGSVIAEIALLRIGEYHFSRREYFEAAAAYDHYMELFSKSEKYRDAMLQGALVTHKAYRGSKFDLTPLIEAQQRYANFNQQYPQSAAKADVAGTLKTIDTQRAADEYETANFYVRTGHKQAAAFYYRRVEHLYPDTEYAARAKIAIEAMGDVAPAKAPPPVIQSPRPAATAAATEPTGDEPASKPAGAEPTDIERMLPKDQAGI